MLFIKRLFKLLIALILLFLVGLATFRLYVWLQQAEQVSARAAEETRSNVQWLSSDTPLIFSFSATRTQAIRVLSNAVFSQQMAFEEPIDYAIEYTLLDANNQAISTKLYHHASKLTPGDNEYQIKQIIEDRKALSVASGQSFYLSAEKIKGASAVALRLISEQPLLTGVVVRVHGKTFNDTTEIEAAWLQLPVDRRERATNYLNIGINALSANEIRNAVTYSWFKMAPQGIPGVDFNSDTLYETLPYNVTTYDFSQQQLNLGDYYTNNNLCASITLTEPDSIVFTTNETDHNLSLVWYDKNQIHAPIPVQVNKTQAGYQTERLNPGLVSICSEQPLLSHFTFASGSPVLTSQDNYYQIDNRISAHYTIAQGSHLNIELRSMQNTQVEVVTYDKNDQVIERYTLFNTNEVSRYDRIIDETTQRQQVAKAQSFYLRTSNKAQKVEIKSSTPALVRLKTRHNRFNYQRTLCHSRCEQADPLFDIAAWFEQLANNHYAFNEQEKLIKIRVFSEPEQHIIEQTFYHSRELFSQLPLSNTALVNSPSRYYQMVKPATVFNYGPITSSDLIASATKVDNPAQSSVIYKENLYSAQELGLENTPVSELEQIANSSQQLYQNWQGARPWVKQRVYKLPAHQSLQIDFDGQRPISVVFKVFSAKSDKQINMQVALNARFKMGLTQQYSIANSRYRLLPSPLSKAFLVHPKESLLFAYPAITKTIDSDIASLNSITLYSDSDIWIAVLEEQFTEEQKVRWWNEELK